MVFPKIGPYLRKKYDDKEGDTWYNMEDWHVYSSDDLLSWKDEGVILAGKDIRWAKRANRCWAPDTAYKDGTYYFNLVTTGVLE